MNEPDQPLNTDPFGINDPKRNPERLTAEKIGVPKFITLTEDERRRRCAAEKYVPVYVKWLPANHRDDWGRDWTLRRPTTPEERAAYAIPDAAPELLVEHANFGSVSTEFTRADWQTLLEQRDSEVSRLKAEAEVFRATIRRLESAELTALAEVDELRAAIDAAMQPTDTKGAR